jgi:two-component system, OmpR family, sensor kinase
MQPLATQRGVQLIEHVQPHVPVSGDQTRLTQLLINLVDNALRYTPTGGNVTVDVTEKSGWAELRVEDTGVGISAEHLPHLFERFYRIDAARARTDGGAGLGLAIAQWISQAHGGQITVDSELGKGSTFRVRIPLAQVVSAPSSSSVESVAVS